MIGADPSSRPPARRPRRDVPGYAPDIAPDRAKKRAERQHRLARQRGFTLIVVLPVLLMLGSVYLHTVAAGLGERVANLEEKIERATVEGQRLDVEASELSAPGRIRRLATEKLQMKDPGALDVEVYESQGEDGTRNEGENIRGQAP